MTVYFSVLVLTVCIEVGLGLLFFRSIRRKKLITVITAANLITNPLINYLNLLYQINISYDSGPVLFLLEIGGICTEWLIFRKYFRMPVVKSLLMSLILNIASFGFGIFFTSLISY